MPTLCFKENLNFAESTGSSSVLISSIIFGLIIPCYTKVSLDLQICKAFATKGSF